MKRIRSTKTIALLGLSILLSVYCAHSNNTPDPSISQIRVRLRLPAEEAVTQTRAAFQDQGIDVEAPLKRDTILHTAPYKFSRGMSATYYAVVHRADSGSVVTLSGTVSNRIDAEWDAVMLGLHKHDNVPLTMEMKGNEKLGWVKLEQVAERLRSHPAEVSKKPDH